MSPARRQRLFCSFSLHLCLKRLGGLRCGGFGHASGLSLLSNRLEFALGFCDPMQDSYELASINYFSHLGNPPVGLIVIPVHRGS
jgi:hypothetical protein